MGHRWPDQIGSAFSSVSSGIESNPGPAKAALAMMGRTDEVYRLPLAPRKKDNRAKMEKVAPESGLLQAQPAASR